jgi:hypothetical protein
MQHWAESAIIALARRSASAGSASIKTLLSEDYDARRVACTVPFTRGVSIHALFHECVQRNRGYDDEIWAAHRDGRPEGHPAGRSPT